MAIFFFIFFIFEPKGGHANAKAQEAIDHSASFFCQVKRKFHSRESNRQALS
jgi:hypothetical protein